MVYGEMRGDATCAAAQVDALKTRLMGATKEFKEVLVLRQENIKARLSGALRSPPCVLCGYFVFS